MEKCINKNKAKKKEEPSNLVFEENQDSVWGECSEISFGHLVTEEIHNKKIK